MTRMANRKQLDDQLHYEFNEIIMNHKKAMVIITEHPINYPYRLLRIYDGMYAAFKLRLKLFFIVVIYTLL